MPQGGLTGIVGYLVFFVVIIYFLTIRPQQKQQKRRQEMINSLKVNDKVVTIGGINGRITKLKEDTVLIRVADKVELEFQKTAVSFVAGTESESAS